VHEQLLGTGPGRPVYGSINVDVYELTQALRSGAGHGFALRLQGYYDVTNAQQPGPGALQAVLFTSRGAVLASTGGNGWQWRGLDDYFNPGSNIGCNNYFFVSIALTTVSVPSHDGCLLTMPATARKLQPLRSW
jgi:hypothetical protein